MKSNSLAVVPGISRPLLWLGALGLALSVVCGVIAAVRGVMIPPEGDLTKAITFNGALGLFWVTLALFVPLARFSPAGQRRWLVPCVAFTVYGYTIETIQTLRGLDPRFTRVGGPADVLAGIVFGALAIVLIAAFSVLAVKLARRGTGGREGLVLLALRYAILATMIAFAAGVWMSVNQGRYTGMAGNILPLHAFGFHALQALPLVAWLFSRSATPEHVARRWVHAAGVAWIAACLAIAWQTVSGRPMSEPSPAIVATLFAWLCWLVCFVRGLLAWRAPRFSRIARLAS